MRVLIASKFWYPRGGLERVMFSEIEELEQRGLTVAHFSTCHPENVESPWSGYFAPYLELGGDSLGIMDKATAATRMFWNSAAAALFARQLDAFGPELVHVHGIHRQLSPSILQVARRRGIAVVQSLHDAHHVCPADVLLKRGVSVCDPPACGRLNYWPAVANRCVKGSLAASALSATETAFQRARGVYESTVTRFVAPSRHLARLMAEGGWRSVPIDIIPNGVRAPAPSGRKPGRYFLIAGRLSREKGVTHALEAARQGNHPVVVAGEGPLAGVLRSEFPDVDFIGHVDAMRIGALLDEAIAAIVPSIVPENAPMAVLEAMAHGVPLIATDIGGIPELVTPEAGVLVPPGDVTSLLAAMDLLNGDRELATRMGMAARVLVQSRFTVDQHIDALLQTYENAIATGTRNR